MPDDGIKLSTAIGVLDALESASDEDIMMILSSSVLKKVAISVLLSGLIGSSGVTFENLNANSDVGTGADQVAIGNHDHLTLLQILQCAETVNPVGSVTADDSPVSLDFDNGGVQTITIAGDVTLAFTNWPSASKSCKMEVDITNGGAFTVTWPGAMVWAGGTPPSLTAAGLDKLVFVSKNNGTTIEGYVIGQDIKAPA